MGFNRKPHVWGVQLLGTSQGDTQQFQSFLLQGGRLAPQKPQEEKRSTHY